MLFHAFSAEKNVFFLFLPCQVRTFSPLNMSGFHPAAFFLARRKVKVSSFPSPFLGDLLNPFPPLSRLTEDQASGVAFLFLNSSERICRNSFASARRTFSGSLLAGED